MTAKDPTNTHALPLAVIATLSVIAIMAVISVTGVCCHRQNKARRDKKAERRVMERTSAAEEISEVYPTPYSLQSSLYSSLPNLPIRTVGTVPSGPPSLRHAYAASRIFRDSSPHPGSVNSRRNSPACLPQPPNLFPPTCSEYSSRPNTPIIIGTSSDPNYPDTNWAVAAAALPADAIVASDDLDLAKGLRDESRAPQNLEEDELASAISNISRVASVISENASSACASHNSYPKHPFPYATNHRRIPSTSSAIIRFGASGKSRDLRSADEMYEGKSDDQQIQNLAPTEGEFGLAKTAVEDTTNDDSRAKTAVEDTANDDSRAKTGVEDTTNDDSSETLTSPKENSFVTDAMDPGFSFGLLAKERRRIELGDGPMCVEEDACTYSSDFESAHESRFSYDGQTQWQHDSDDGSAKSPIHANNPMAESTEMEPHKQVLASQIPGDDERQIPIAHTQSKIVDTDSNSTTSLLHPESGLNLPAMGNITVSPPSRTPSPSAIQSLGIAFPLEMVGVEGSPWTDDCPLPPPLPIGRWQKHHSLPHPRTISVPHHLAPYAQPTFRHQHSLAGYSHSSYSTSSTSFSSLVLSEAAMAGQIQEQNRNEAERQHEIRRSALSRHPALASLMLDDRREAHRGRY